MRRVKRLLRRKIPHQVAIQGDYNTGNIGDKSIGVALKQSLQERGIRARLFDANTTSANASLPVMGGGGVLHDWFGTENLRRRLNFVSDGGTILGVGVPGIRTEKAKKLVRQKLKSVEKITVRDERSRKKLEFVDTPVSTTADPAFLLDVPNTEQRFQTGVNFRPWFDLDSGLASTDPYQEGMEFYLDYDSTVQLEDARDAFIENTQRIVSELEDPIFIPFHQKDEKFAREFLDIDVYPYEFDVKTTLSRVNSVRQMVTMRYHSLVFATLCEKPVLAINYDPKVGELTDRLDIPSYRPHDYIPVSFDKPANREDVRRQSERNIELLADILHNKPT